MLTKTSSILCNLYHTICISNDYNVYSFGKCEFGAHGYSGKEIIPPKQINNLLNIKAIACGDRHCVCLDYEGYIFSFGKNNCGQLGISKDEIEQTHIPQKISIPACIQIACGGYFTLCLTEDNNLYSFGINNYKEQYELENNSELLSPQLIPDLNNIEYIVCGGNHSICKTFDNEFYSWGDNEFGQLGQGNEVSCDKPIQCFNWPDNIIDIKCGYDHSLLLTEEGQVYSFGKTVLGQLGIIDKHINEIASKNKNSKSINIPILIKNLPEIQRIECGYNHSMCIDINNNLWVFGYNYYGQLGLGHKKNMSKPTTNPILKDVIDISSKGNHTFVKTNDNKIYAFGNNTNSQFGIETSEIYIRKPIQIFIKKEDIWCSLGKSRAKSARK